MAKTEIRVRYEETDQMGVVYYANYLTWFEIGRTELLRDKGYSYSDLEEEGFLLPVVNVECNYHQPANYDDLLTLETNIVKLKRSKIEFEYKVYRQDELLTTAKTVHPFVDQDLKPISLKKEAPKVWKLLKKERK